jgi:hypothetical protein
VNDDPTTTAARPPDIGRRTLSPFGYAVCVAVPILIAALGFTYLHFHYDKEQLVSGDRLHILTSDWQPGDPSMHALTSGRLVLDDGCLRLETADGAQVDLVWPAGYEATEQRVGPSNQLKVYDPDRDIVARSEQTLGFGGGFTTDLAPYADSPCAPASDQVFLVQGRPTIADGS